CAVKFFDLFGIFFTVFHKYLAAKPFYLLLVPFFNLFGVQPYLHV
ncbi:hypothetical protein LCGC14_2918460, partial [marine sediment metagenome]